MVIEFRTYLLFKIWYTLYNYYFITLSYVIYKLIFTKFYIFMISGLGLKFT